MENTFENAIDFVNKKMPDYLKVGQARQSEIARTLVEYANEVLLQHGVSGKRPTDEEVNNFLEEYGFVVPYNGTNNFYDEHKIRHAKAGIDFVLTWLSNEALKAACASGAVDKTVRCGYCKELLTEVRPGKHQCDNRLCQINGAGH